MRSVAKSGLGSFASAVIALACIMPAAAPAGSYPQQGGGPGHLGVASGGGPAQLSSPRIAVGPDLYWVSQAGVAVGGGKVVGLTEYDDGIDWHIGVVAARQTDGQILWTAPVPDLVWDSWSSPAIDLAGGIIVVASDNRVTGLSLFDGHEVWHVTAKTGKTFVNASPTIEAGVAYIAEFGSGSTLYAINTVTGQVKWQGAAGYIAGGNTVAVSATRVLLVGSDGRFRTFDKQTGAADVNVLLTTGNGFFGGVAAEDGAAYAVSYAFGPRYGATKLFKINPASGAVIWSVPAPRTDTIPVVTADTVFVSGGDNYQKMGDGTDNASLWAFDKTSGQVRWSTPLAGGWTCQPVYAEGIVYVSTLSDMNTPPMSGVLYAFDVTRTPQQAGFVIGSTDRIACSVAVANGNVYGTGLYGLLGIGPGPIPGDISGDGSVNVVDLLMVADAWGRSVGDVNYNVDCDLDGNGSVDVLDLLVLSGSWGQGH